MASWSWWNKREGQHNLECSLASLPRAMDESPLSLPTNAPSMPNVPPLKSQYDSTEAEGQFDLLMFQFVWRMMRMMKILSASVESDDDINEDFGLGDDRISREIWGK
uniref:Uncharacterized protein n=1 Tax=Quercus lobata TaxID=97700 RepID=A0A7N2RCJ8_QUELO